MKPFRRCFRTTAAAVAAAAASLLLCWNANLPVLSTTGTTTRNSVAVVVVTALVVPHRRSTTHRHGGRSERKTKITTTTRLAAGAFGSGLPPPPPPPPPPHLPDNGPLEMIKSLLDGGASLDNVVNDVTDALDRIQIQMLGKGELLDAAGLEILKQTIADLDDAMLAELDQWSNSLQTEVLRDYPALLPVFDTVRDWADPMLQSPTLSLVVSTFVTYEVVSSLLQQQQQPPGRPYPAGKYDPTSARMYFDRRLGQVLARGMEIFVKAAGFGLDLLRDKIDGKISENEDVRRRQLSELLTELGPTFIKVGQSLSIRTDLLSPAYARGLATLQDQVPAFDTAVATGILEEEWGRPLNDVIDGGTLSAEPIAAASLGQVYKARLRSTGEDVAIKVQRPDIAEQIALDMHLLREVAGPVKRLFNLNTDTVGTVDAWGTGFVDELNYLQEAANAETFTAELERTPLSDVVFAPAVVKDLSTNKVLVTAWVDGERLDRSAAADVTAVCSIAMNTYLTMMLDFGLLHCDPHPGNLLLVKEGKTRATAAPGVNGVAAAAVDGASPVSDQETAVPVPESPRSRLAILDWGMTTRLEKDLQLTLIEHMAHLTSADYDEIPRDLLLLGFIPPEKSGEIKDSGVVELLADVYSQWTAGGGAKSVNVNEVVGKLQDLTAEKGNLFQIPPYFAYIAKSFSVLEGIGLSNDPKYSIVNECLPYVSRRLLTDADKMGPALSTFVFGPTKTDRDRIVDYDRVEQLVTGFGEYTTSASGALLGKTTGDPSSSLSRLAVLETAADQILDLILSREETPLQEILLEQTAKIVSASSRSVWSAILKSSGTLPSGRTVLGTMVDPLGLWRSSPLVSVTDQDQKTVETTFRLVELIQEQIRNPLFDLTDLSRTEALRLSQMLTTKLWQRRRGLLTTSNRFVRKLLELTADRLERGREDDTLTSEGGSVHDAAASAAGSRTFPQQQQQPRMIDSPLSDAFVTAAHKRRPRLMAESSVTSNRKELQRRRQPPSARLIDARQRLQALQQLPQDEPSEMEDGNTSAVKTVPEAEPVNTRLSSNR